MRASPTTAPARNPQNSPSRSSLQPSQPRTSPSTNASFTSPKPMLRGDTRCSTPSATMATTPPRTARPKAAQAWSPTAARPRSATVAIASGYTIRFGNRKCSRSMTERTTSPAASARNAGSTHESWYRSASPTKSETVTPARSAARGGCRSRRLHPVNGSRCGTRSTTISRPIPARRPAPAHTATTARVTRRPTPRPASLWAGRRRGPHDVEWRLGAGPERERQSALAHEHAQTADGAHPAPTGFAQQRRLDRVHRVEDELAGVKLCGIERRRLTVHPERRRVDHHVEAFDGQLVESDGDPAGRQRRRAAGSLQPARGDRDLCIYAPERVGDRPRRATGPENDGTLARDRDPLVVHGAQEALAVGGVTDERPTRVHDRVDGPERGSFG